MCSRGTSLRERMACACVPVTGVGGAGVVAGIVVAVQLNVLTGILIALAGACGAVAALTVLRVRRSGGLWLVHRYTPPAAAVAAPAAVPVEVPWYERAQVGSRDSG